MQQKTVQQPIVTDAEIAKTARYNRDIKASGYRPWVTVRQSHTYGQGQIVYSHKTRREHHLLSRGERAPFFYLITHDPQPASRADMASEGLPRLHAPIQPTCS